MSKFWLFCCCYIVRAHILSCCVIEVKNALKWSGYWCEKCFEMVVCSLGMELWLIIVRSRLEMVEKIVVALLWHCCGIVVALLWHCCGIDVTLLSNNCCIDGKLWWHCCETALELLWHWWETVVALLWNCFRMFWHWWETVVALCCAPLANHKPCLFLSWPQQLV
jgi:hypothetical protein